MEPIKYLKAFNNQLVLSETSQGIEFIASKATIRTILQEAKIAIRWSGKYHGDSPVYLVKL